MILEVVIALATLAGGASVLRTSGLRGWGLVPLGFVVGTSIVTLVGTAQVAIGLPTSAYLTYGLATGVPFIWWTAALLTRRDVRLSLVGTLTTGVAVVPIVAFFWSANLARVTPDSFNLVASGALMHAGRMDTLAPSHVEDWQVAMGAIHGVANVQGEAYLRAATPLLALATVGALVWLIQRALATTATGPIWWLAVLGGALLLTNQRFLYNAFYLNRHVFVAAALVIVAASVWGLLREHVASPSVLLALLATMLPGLALGRAETPVIAGLVLLPLLASHQVPRSYRAGLLALLGATIVLRNGSLAVAFVQHDEPVSTSASTMLLLGILMLVTAGLIRFGWGWFDPLPSWTARAVEGLLWVTAVGIALLEPRLVLDSAEATFRNVALGVGGWGISLVVLAVITLVVFLVTAEGDRVALRFPLTTFIPYAVVLAYLRAPGGLPYRPATGDSLNRMLLHLVPLAILYVATAPTAAGWRRSVRALALPQRAAVSRETTLPTPDSATVSEGTNR